jgi:thiol-disulfide isomerase/thioredoxin
VAVNARAPTGPARAAVVAVRVAVSEPPPARPEPSVSARVVVPTWPSSPSWPSPSSRSCLRPGLRGRRLRRTATRRRAGAARRWGARRPRRRRPAGEVPPPDADLAPADWPATAAWIRREVEAGRPVLMNLFASWCIPCKREMPMLLAAADAEPDIAFLGVATNDTTARRPGPRRRARHHHPHPLRRARRRRRVRRRRSRHADHGRLRPRRAGWSVAWSASSPRSPAAAARHRPVTGRIATEVLVPPTLPGPSPPPPRRHGRARARGRARSPTRRRRWSSHTGWGRRPGSSSRPSRRRSSPPAVASSPTTCAGTGVHAGPRPARHHLDDHVGRPRGPRRTLDAEVGRARWGLARRPRGGPRGRPAGSPSRRRSPACPRGRAGAPGSGLTRRSPTRSAGSASRRSSRAPGRHGRWSPGCARPWSPTTPARPGEPDSRRSSRSTAGTHPDEVELAHLGDRPLAVVGWPDDPGHPLATVARRWAALAPRAVSSGELHLTDLEAPGRRSVRWRWRPWRPAARS